MESYEKKYKNALEWARQVINGETGFIRKEVEEVFPELVESEEERIRKELIEFVKSRSGFKQEYIDWLEKQGKKEVDPRYENLEGLIAADDIYQMAMNDKMVEEAKLKAIKALSKLEISKLLGIEKQSKKLQDKTIL